MPPRSWFTRALLPWYRAHHRPLPWRATQDPYPIWLSEVILQQTRVDQGRAYWQRFVERYPTVHDLAAASEDEVLKLWQGLGYYSRARNLLVTARQVVDEHGGHFPSEYDKLLDLKGIGDYTASAIASIAYGRPEAVVDGNVYRVLARVFGIDTPIDTTEGRTAFKQLAQDLVDPANPGEHNQAVMELGALVCTPRDPTCQACPLGSRCAAQATGRITELPVKAGRTRVRDRFFNYLHVEHGGGLYLHQRKGKDIWLGLFEPPLIESEKPLTRTAFGRTLERELGAGWTVTARSEEQKHVLSHQVIHAVFWELRPPKGFAPPPGWQLVPSAGVAELAVPRLIERWLRDR